MKITVTSDILEHEYDGSPVTSDFIHEYVDNADSLLVPGVSAWMNVEVTRPNPNTAIVVADLVTDDVVRSGEYQGQEVSEAWIRGYVEGADAFWAIPGVLKATDISFA